MTGRNTAAPIARLEVQRLATIEALTLDLHTGFHAFTGETGAGKSIIVDALGLLLGGRASSDLVRTGAEDLLVTGFWGEDVASRRVTAGGRSNARLDGEVVSLRELSEWSQSRVTIHWQHSAQSLLTPANQRSLLDRLTPAAVQTYSAAYLAWKEARDRLDALRTGERERARQLDLLTYQARELAEIAPQIGEDEPLSLELTRLSHLDTIASGAAEATKLLSDSDVNAQGLMADALRALNASARYDQNVAQLQTELREALDGLQAVVSELRNVTERSAPDPEELAQVEARLAQLSKLQAKYGPTLADVVAFQQDVTRQLEALERDEGDASTLEREVQARWAEVMAAGQKLRAARSRASGPLSKQLMGVIRELGMPHARLAFSVDPLPEPAAHGLDSVTIRFTANPGEDPGDLADTASGGELSRVMLAISTILGADTPTVVFDEVDAGIGGAAALKVAEQLAHLAGERQVLVVTHLAQIAARAHHHYKVEKTVESGRTVTRVRLLSGAERLEEIARMLSGNLSQAALSHARELLEAR